MTVLCYHAVEPGWRSPLAVEPDVFEQQCAWLRRHRRVLPLHEAMAHADRRGRLPRGMAVLTFDDGFASLHEHAWPILERYDLPATVFLVSATLSPSGHPVDWVDTPPPWSLRTLTRDQVLEMAGSGVDFASHSWAHRDLTTLGFDEAVDDLSRSRELLEDLLDRPVTHLAYPRGRHDADVRAAAAKAGYSWSFALPQVREPDGAQSVPRVGVFQGNGVASLAVKSQPWYLPARTNRVYPRVARLARRLR